MKSCEYWPKGGKAEPVGVGDTALIWGGYYGAVGAAVSIKTFKQPVTIIPSSSVLEIKKDGEVVLVTSKFERSALKIDSVVFAGVQADDSLFQ